MIKKETLKVLGIDPLWEESLNKALSRYEIKDKTEIAMFISQCSYESEYFTVLEESFNYTPKKLFESFKNRLNGIEEAKEICKYGERVIANFIYNGRFGNGYETDDGYNYRGRGIIKIVGKDNYKCYGDKIEVDIVNYPNLLLEYRTSCLTACCYWNEKGSSIYAKNGDLEAVTKIIKGELNSLDKRYKLFETAKIALD